MKSIVTAGIACLLGTFPLLAQQEAPSQAPAPLTLRGGAMPTGLYGYWDYQSNASSPEFLKIQPGNWNRLQTVFVNSLNDSDIAGSRRVGYAYSSDGGTTWRATRSIADTRLGIPALQLSSAGIPYIATYGDQGTGNASQVYAASVAGELGPFAHLATLPNITASGRTGGGVLWPAFALTRDGAKAVFVGAHSWGENEGIAPIQTIVLDLGTRQTETPRWKNLADSLISVGVYQHYAIARAANGTLGVAYYRYPLTRPDLASGVYFTESTDNGATWTPAQPILAGAVLNTDGYNLNGDPDTALAGYNIDLAYNGDDPQIVFTGDVYVGSFDASQVQYRNIHYWSRSRGLKMIARTHQVPGLGGVNVPRGVAQSDMNSVSYPTLSVGEDGRHIVVAFSAISQERGEGNSLISAVSEDGFFYYRIWAVGSQDGGTTWGTPFIVQDFAGGGGDSASIEYPSAAEVGRMLDSDYELLLTYQAKRYPGVFSFTGDGQTAGRKQEVHQYFQRFMVSPEMFRSTSSVPVAAAAAAAPAIAALYPNPASSVLTLEYALAARGSVEIAVINALGEEVLRDDVGVAQEAGSHVRAIDISSLPAGAYRCAIRQNGSVVTRPLNVVR